MSRRPSCLVQPLSRRKSFGWRHAALASLLPSFLLISACSDGPLYPGPEDRYTLEIVGGTAVSATVGDLVPVEVRVRDQKGAPIVGMAIAWRVAEGSGTIQPLSSKTDAAGRAQAQWTLGTVAGMQRAYLWPVEEPDLESAMTATALPDAPAMVQIPVDTATLHALREEVIVRPRVRDRHGNATEEQTLAWSSADPAIVAVDSGGRLVARAKGATMITAALGELADTLHVVVAPRGAITITFDDGWLTTYTNAFPVLREHGLPANVGVYTDAVGWGAYMNESQLRELHDAGWSMVSHTVNHPNLTEVSDAQLLKEIRDSKAWLEERKFRGSNVFIVPFHEWGERERTLIEEHYDAARGVSHNQVWPDTLVEWMPTDPYALTAIEPEFLPYTTAEGREILRHYLDRVAERGEYLDVFFHRIPDEDLEEFRKLVEIMAEHRDLIRPFHELFGPPRVLE